jgi:TolB-like protein
VGIVELDTFHAIEESDMSDIAAIRKVFPAHEPTVVTNAISGKILVVVGNSNSPFPPRGGRMDGKAIDTIPALHRSENMGASESAIRQQLRRTLESPIFVHSERLSRFLRFIVEHVIGGNQNYLKEYVIGSEVYDRRPPYNPSQDSIVRTEARRLRGKLKEYYQTEGKDDPIYIYLRPGSYIPVLQSKEALVGPQSAADTNDPLLSAKTSSTTIAILPFHDITGSSLSSLYARGIPDELAYTLMRSKGCRVISPALMAHFNAREQDVTAAMSKVGAQIAYEGSVREEGNHIRVTARIIDPAGFQVWTQRFDAEADSHALFIIEEQIASALSVGFEVLFGHSPR